MAQKVQVLLVDDLDGSEADETVRFVLDGVEYEIDLSTRNAEQLRRVLGPYIQRARQAKPANRRRRARTRPGRERSSEIRDWARLRGHEVSERGRIPAEIIRQYVRQDAALAVGPPGPDFGDDDEDPGPGFGEAAPGPGPDFGDDDE